jgi:hypothetical protein
MAYGMADQYLCDTGCAVFHQPPIQEISFTSNFQADSVRKFGLRPARRIPRVTVVAGPALGAKGIQCHGRTIRAYSARVAHHLMSGPISGLLYPSIAAQNKSQNLAVKADFVDTGLRLINASFYHIKEIKDKHQYETEELDFAIPDSKGALEWKGRKKQWVLRKQGEELKMVSNGWTWDACSPDGSLVEPE